jgi:hypothetical protein
LKYVDYVSEVMMIVEVESKGLSILCLTAWFSYDASRVATMRSDKPNCCRVSLIFSSPSASDLMTHPPSTSHILRVTRTCRRVDDQVSYFFIAFPKLHPKYLNRILFTSSNGSLRRTWWWWRFGLSQLGNVQNTIEGCRSIGTASCSVAPSYL